MKMKNRFLEVPSQFKISVYLQIEALKKYSHQFMFICVFFKTIDN